MILKACWWITMWKNVCQQCVSMIQRFPDPYYFSICLNFLRISILHLFCPLLSLHTIIPLVVELKSKIEQTNRLRYQSVVCQSTWLFSYKNHLAKCTISTLLNSKVGGVISCIFFFLLLLLLLRSCFASSYPTSNSNSSSSANHNLHRNQNDSLP